LKATGTGAAEDCSRDGAPCDFSAKVSRSVPSSGDGGERSPFEADVGPEDASSSLWRSSLCVWRSWIEGSFSCH